MVVHGSVKNQNWPFSDFGVSRASVKVEVAEKKYKSSKYVSRTKNNNKGRGQHRVCSHRHKNNHAPIFVSQLKKKVQWFETKLFCLSL